MIKKLFHIYTDLNLEKVNLVSIDINKKANKKTIYPNNKEFIFELNDNIDYFYFEINKNKTNIMYTNTLTNKYILKYNHHLSSYTIALYDEYEKGTYYNYVFNTKEKLPSYFLNQKTTLYIPKNIDTSKKVGLIISFDGHNAFYHDKYKKTNVYEGTQLDIIADILKNEYQKDFLVLGIKNNHHYRSKELTMSSDFGILRHDKIKNYHNEFSNGVLETYMDFIIQDILTFIFDKYNIDKSNIGIIGQSSGGLASYYAIVKYSNIFSFALSLSPAFPLFKISDLISFYKNTLLSNNKQPKIYMYSGNISSLEKGICQATKEVYYNLKNLNNNLSLRINLYAKHNEIAWRLAINEGIKLVLED